MITVEKYGRKWVGWRLEDAAEEVHKLSDYGRSVGYLFALYGSTLGGSGRDLDLMCVQCHAGAISPEVLIDELAAKFLAKEKTERYEGLFGVLSNCLHLPDGRVIDVQVYPLRRRSA
jgi:hypothetical protein